MADPLVAHDDLELFLTTWYRLWLPEQGIDDVEVDRVEPNPDEPFPKFLLVIRDDGGPETDLLTAEASIGLTMLGGTRAFPKPAVDRMKVVLAGLNQIPGTDLQLVAGLRNPVSALLSRGRPYQVEEAQDRARIYAPATFGVTAAPL